MKKLIVALSFFMGLVIMSAEATELNNNARKIAQPIQSKSAYKSLDIRRFVLAGSSEADYLNLINNVAHEVGSDNQKMIRVIWSNKKSGERIQNALIKKGILKDRINLVKNSKKRPLYSLYVEVESVSAKPIKCKKATAEHMVIYREHDPCALENNNRIQKRN